MKLTAKIAMCYQNAHVTTKYDEGKSYKIVGVSEWEGNLQVQTSENDTDWWNIDQCQLILTPLDKISDEDAVDVAKILIPQCFFNTQKGWQVSRNYTTTGYPYIKIHHPKKVYSVQIDCTLVNFDIDDMEDRVTASCDTKPVSIIDYLRSKGYDCGHGSIPNLIAAGVAVEKEIV